MGVSYIEGQVQRVNRNLLLVNGAFLTLLLLFTGFMILGAWLIGQSFNRLHDMNTSHTGSGYYVNVGPADMTHPMKIRPSDVASESRLRELAGRAVTLNDSHVMNLGFPVWDWMGRSTGKNRAHAPMNYHVSNASGRPFLIIPNANSGATTFTGIIRPLSDVDRGPATAVLQSRGIRKEPQPYILDGISGEPRKTANAAPVEMHPVSGQTSGFPSYLVVYVLLMGLFGWNVFKALYRMKNPLTHPIYATLGQYGPPLEVARSIDAERRQGVQTLSPAEFTWSWLLVPTFFGLKVVHLEHIVWVFQMVSRLNFVPVLTSLRIVERKGKGAAIYANTPQLSRIMDYITQNRPWIIAGYDPAIRDRFSQNRAAFIADVDARRNRYQPVQTAPGAPQTGFPAQRS